MAYSQATVHPISLGFVKIYLIKGQKAILVDTGLKGSGKRILKALSKFNINPKAISLIILTHNHTDHTGAIKELKVLTGAKIAIHQAEANSLKNGQSSPVMPLTLVGKVFAKFFGQSVIEGVPADILIRDELDLRPFGVEGKVLHTPGHTEGSVSVLLDDGSIIVGDLFSIKTGSKGFKTSLPIIAASLPLTKKTLEKLASLNPSVIYTSHGDAGPKDAITEVIGKIKV
ncbi:MAG: MBL fold metallo-hydrolase [Clostridia bacterium]|nr:MBL fold metallo-hydrolase [Clostridia bacterium]